MQIHPKSLIFISIYAIIILYSYMFYFVSVPHNRNYVDFLFIVSKVPTSVFVCGKHHLCSLYKFLLYSQRNDLKYRQGGQYPFANCNMYGRKDDENYEGILYLCLLLRLYKGILAISTRSFYPKAYRFCWQTPNRFLYRYSLYNFWAFYKVPLAGLQYAFFLYNLLSLAPISQQRL